MIKIYTLKTSTLAILCFLVAPLLMSAQSNVSTFIPTVATGTYASVVSPDYTFATGPCDDTYWVSPTSTAATGVGTTTAVTGIPMGFSVTVGGIAYDKIALSSNGFMTLAPVTATTFNVATGGFSYAPVSSTPPTGTLVVSPFGRDMETNLTGSSIKLKSSGTAPNRTYEVEYVNFRNYAGTGQSYTFKTTFNESGAPVVFSYSVINPGTSTTSTFQMGLRSGTTWTNLAGTWATNAPGTTSSATFAVGAVTSGTTVTWAIPSFCPITVAPTVTNGTSCGATAVTLGAASSLGYATPYWSSTTNTRIISKGTSLTTPVITSGSTSYDVRLGAVSNTLPPASGGPSLPTITLIPTTLATGTFSNGNSFTAIQPFFFDSCTVSAHGGTGKFAIVISKKSGSIYSNLGSTTSPYNGKPALVTTTEQRTDTITINTTGTGAQEFRVPVKLALAPGEYYINVVKYSGTANLLFSQTGVVFPYSIGTMATVDSCRRWTSTGAYSAGSAFYVFNWKLNPMCFGPAATATATFAPVPSAILPYTATFSPVVPCNWVPSGGVAQWAGKTSYTGYGYTSATVNGSPFIFVDDDAAGSTAATTNSTMTTPAFPALGYDTLTMKFKSVFKSWGGKGYIEVWRPVNGVFGWHRIDSIKVDEGVGAPATGWAAVTKTYNVTAYQSNDFKARFIYDDRLAGVSQWAGYWAIDDFELTGALSPTGNVRVAVTTDSYGTEVSWKIVNTSNKLVYASGGPFPDVTPYVAATATHIDTVAIPLTGNYEFRLTDSYGDGLYDGTNTGTYIVEKLCAWGNSIIDTGSGANDNDPGGAVVNVASYDSAVFDMSCIQYKNVTFNVDMNQVTQAFTTPEVNGLWNSWCGNCNPLTDANGDGIWTTTLPLPVGSTQEYKFSADNWTIQEQNNPAASCTNGNATNTNRVLVIPATDTVLNVVCWSQCTACDVDVTLKVNMAWEKANNAISANGVHVVGDFQGWSPSTTPMTDANNDGIYEVTVTVPANSSIKYKFINGNTWANNEVLSAATGSCVVSDGNGNFNRGATFAYGDSTMSPVCFGKCTDCAAGLGESLQNVSLFPNPTRGQFNLARMDAATEVEVSVLDLQGKVLTVAKWNEGVDALSIDLSSFANGVYMVRMTSEEGSRTMRVSVQK
jgi:hypothetical protein